MSAATYTTDLLDITLCDSGTFTEFTGWAAGTPQTVPETDYYIQNSGSGGCVSSTVKTTQNSLAFDSGSGKTVPTDGAVFFWQAYWAPATCDTFANGGQRCVIGSAVGTAKMWKSGGNDYPPNPYGGWKNVAIDPAQTADYNIGTPGDPMTLQFFGIALYLPTAYPGKGAMFGMDAIRYGRGEARVAGGTTPDAAATFTGLAAANDALSTRWGLFQAIAGGFLWKGLMTLGYGAAVRFTDSNKNIVVDDCPRVSANFNKIEIRNVSSEINWTNINFQSLANTTYGTVSKGRLEVVDDCNVNLVGCVFTGMDTFIFKASSDILNSTFRNCGQITANGANFAGTLFEGYEGTSDTGYLIWDSNHDTIAKLANAVFTKGTAATHAIHIGTNAPTEITLTNMTFNGYNASNGQTDSTIYIADSNAGHSYIINTVGCSGNISYKSAGASVSIVPEPLTLGFVVTDENQNVIEGAYCYIDNNDQSPYIMNDQTDVNGEKSVSYSGGAAAGTRWRVRKYGYKPFKQIIDIGGDVDIILPVTLVADPQQPVQSFKTFQSDSFQSDTFQTTEPS